MDSFENCFESRNEIIDCSNLHMSLVNKNGEIDEVSFVVNTDVYSLHVHPGPISSNVIITLKRIK